MLSLYTIYRSCLSSIFDYSHGRSLLLDGHVGDGRPFGDATQADLELGFEGGLVEAGEGATGVGRLELGGRDHAEI